MGTVSVQTLLLALAAWALNSLLTWLTNPPAAAEAGRIANLRRFLAASQLRAFLGAQIHAPTPLDQLGQALSNSPLNNRPTKLLPALILGLAICLSACGAKLSAAEQASIAGLGASNAAVQKFELWDAQHQLAIVKASKTKQQAQRRLAAYRSTRATLLDLCQSLAISLEGVANSLGSVPPAASPAPAPPPAGGVQ